MRCGLSQREAGEAFGTGAKSFEKYQGGTIRPSGPTRRLLALAIERPDLFMKPARGSLPLPTAQDVAVIRKTLREARLERLYAPLFNSMKGKVTPAA